jgi:hypothetical protein
MDRCDLDPNGSNYGYRDNDGNFRTIMAYNCVQGECDKNRKSGCTRIQRFSNPNVKFNYKNKKAGDVGADSASHIDNVANEVAAYFSRPTQLPTHVPSVEESSAPTAMSSSLPSITAPSSGPTTAASAAPSLAPSSLPTALPSNAPSVEKSSAPTATPSSLPSSLPSITASSSGPSAVASVDPPKPSPSTSPTLEVDGVQCADNDEYQIEKVNGELKPCSWLTKNKFTNTRFCGRKAVRENCPKSCLTCDNDDYLVLRNNGLQNRCSWLNEKENRRKRFCNQEEIIKNCPISCQCANDYMFNFEGGVKCSWLARGNNDGSQRRKLFCPQRSANRLIREACPLVCEESNCSF